MRKEVPLLIVQAIRDFDRLVRGNEFASAVKNFSGIYVKEVEKFFQTKMRGIKKNKVLK